MENFQSEEKDKHIGSENTSYQHKSKITNSLKSKIACPLKFMVTQTGRIDSILVIAVKIITIQEKENLSLMNKFQESFRR